MSYLLKKEIRMGVVSAIISANSESFLVTPGVFRVLQKESPKKNKKVTVIGPWRPNPGLSPQLQQVFTLRVLYGMSAPSVAQEINLAPGTIDKYMQYVYQRLSMNWGDEKYLNGVQLDKMPPDVKAFHRYSLPLSS